MQLTKIEYLTHTFNPIAMRCTPVSAGCKNCWHLRMARRFVGMDHFPVDVQMSYHGGDPVIRVDELSAPLRLRKPARIGVQFMGDLFHADITNAQIAAVFGVMAACPQHAFFVLTKRIDRAYSFTEWSAETNSNLTLPVRLLSSIPLPNVWLGVSVENQTAADDRIPWLLKTPAAHRFVSCEPLLGGINICAVPDSKTRPQVFSAKNTALGDLNWVIAGAETGPGARPCHLDWLRSLRDQCIAAGVPFFLKQVNARGDRGLDGRMHEETP